MVEHNLAKVGVAGSTPVSRSIFFSLFLFITVSFSLQADTIHLKNRYTVDSDCITLETFGLPGREKCLKRLPENRIRLQVPTYEAAEWLKKAGFDVRLPKSGIITFERSGLPQDPGLRQKIAEAYRHTYPTIDIRSILVEPTGSKRERFRFAPECTVRLAKSALQRNSGTFVVKCGKRRHFFRYSVDAAIGVYKANHQIKKDKMISLKAIAFERVPFVKIHDIPLTGPIEGRYIARQNIAAGKIITRRMVAPVPDVKKNERVLCIYEDGPVRIEFEATAMQNGYIGENITVKKTDGRSLRGVVTGKKEVEIR